MACWLILSLHRSVIKRVVYMVENHCGLGDCCRAPCFFTYEIQKGMTQFITDAFVLRRNFYGVLSVHMVVKLEGPVLSLRNGTIQHGEQFLESDQSQSRRPITPRVRVRVMDYFSDKEKRRVGMLGLGVGTIAAYSKRGDVFRAYEINPDVIELAINSEIFSLGVASESGVKENYSGDARISLEKERGEGDVQNFDVLVLDVFSGDDTSVPTTRQAFLSTSIIYQKTESLRFM